MKKTIPVLAVIVILLLSCKKTNNTNVTSISCDGLVTDTAGTNDSARIYMPTAFTPNGDGLNDSCKVYFTNIDSISFTIYDANNNIVFTSSTVSPTVAFLRSWEPTTISATPVKFYYRIQAVTTADRKIGICGNVYELPCFPASMPEDSFRFEDQISNNGFDLPSNENLPTCH
jgi:hypothetical protein